MKRADAGFSLMEVLVVVAIIGAVLAVVIPRAHRASVDAKYQLVRQNCSELAAWANTWAQGELERQPLEVSGSAVTLTLGDYFLSLGDQGSVDWVADSDGSSNWQGTLQTVGGGYTPGAAVADIMPQDKIMRNPFNGVSVFISSNLPASAPVTGAVGCAWVSEGSSPDYNYFALVFQGTDSTTLSGGTGFYAGQDETSLAGLRNGVFMARTAQ